jgi:hypothetical protein
MEATRAIDDDDDDAGGLTMFCSDGGGELNLLTPSIQRKALEYTRLNAPSKRTKGFRLVNNVAPWTAGTRKKETREDWQAPRQLRNKLTGGGDAVMLWGEERKKEETGGRRGRTEKKNCGQNVLSLAPLGLAPNSAKLSLLPLCLHLFGL